MSDGWRKRGLLWDPPGDLDWAPSHATLPTLDRIEGDRHWLYFSPRDEQGRSHIARAEVILDQGTVRLERFDPTPVISPGPLGSFDDRGTTVSSIVAEGERRLAYYGGWSLGVTVPFYFFAGVALSEDGGGTYRRHSDGPILDRNAIDPYLTGSPFVLREGERWRMWYVSGSGWEAGEPPRHRYHLRYAESADGIGWERDGTVCIDYRDDSEYAIARPCVIRDGDRYRMWFCARGENYRLGYAESADGIKWERDDGRAGLDVGSGGWDEEMMAYPFVISHEGLLYLFYNGNGYGHSGIGYAVAEGDV